LLLVEAVDCARLRLFSKEVMRFLGWLILIDLDEWGVYASYTLRESRK
jgi:hypothetical protein